MERITANRQYDTTTGNQGQADQDRAEATAAAQDPANGLNRTISVKKSEPFSEALDKSRTSHKSLCDRICDLWLIRKICGIIGLFKKLLTCSGKDVASASEEADRLMNIRKCTALADTLFYKVHALLETIEKQDPPFDQWAKAESRIEEKIEEFSTELTQLERDISACKSRKSDDERKAMNCLVTQDMKTRSHIDWLRFYLVYGKKDNYRNHSINYLSRIIDRVFLAASKALLNSNHRHRLISRITCFHDSALRGIMKNVNKGQIVAALVEAEKFRSLVRESVASVGRLDAFEIHEENIVPTMTKGCQCWSVGHIV